MKNFFAAASAAVAFAVLAVPETFAGKPLEYICYSPYRDGQQPGGAEPTEAQIREDFQILAPLVKGIRTYTCSGIHAQIPKLAKEAGLEVHMGAWIGKDDASNVAEVNALIALAKSGNTAIKGLIIGNEVLLRQDVTKARLIEYIKMAKNANTGIPVTTADIYQRIGDNSADLAPVVDYVLCHVHPYWENVAAENGANHVLKGWNQVKAKYPGKQVIVGETGYPSAGQSRNPAVPSEAAQARFTDDLARLGAAQGMSFMLFTSFDEAWKGAEGPVGANWGIWRANRTEKPAVAKVKALPTTAIRLPGRSLARRISLEAGMRVDALGREVRGVFIDRNGGVRANPAWSVLTGEAPVATDAALGSDASLPAWTLTAP
jgi:exo-beta-1,3-glucanase (GH17 family)